MGEMSWNEVQWIKMRWSEFHFGKMGWSGWLEFFEEFILEIFLENIFLISFWNFFGERFPKMYFWNLFQENLLLKISFVEKFEANFFLWKISFENFVWTNFFENLCMEFFWIFFENFVVENFLILLFFKLILKWYFFEIFIRIYFIITHGCRFQ